MVSEGLKLRARRHPRSGAKDLVLSELQGDRRVWLSFVDQRWYFSTVLSDIFLKNDKNGYRFCLNQ
jgi:hypothetical protein